MTNNSENIVLSKSKFMSIIIAAIVGIGFIVLPSGLTKLAHQDAWISAILGAIYPVLFIIISSYIIEKNPNDNILTISKKCFGKFGGSVYNFLYLTFCVFTGSDVIRGYSNLMRAYVATWITPLKIILICTAVVAYVALNGLETVGKICEVSVLIIIILLIAPIQTLKIGSVLNIKPIMGSGVKAIINGIQGSILSYSGVELILLFHPYVSEKKKIKWYSIISIIFITSLYAWGTFITLFYLSPDVVAKSQWPILLATQSVTVTVINNFSYLFLFMWSLVGMRCISVYYYSTMIIIKDFLPKLSNKWLGLVVYIIFSYGAFKIGSEINRRSIADNVIKIYTVANFIAMIFICIILKFKKDENTSKRNQNYE